MKTFNGLGLNLGDLSRLSNAETRSISAENPTGAKGHGARHVDPNHGGPRDRVNPDALGQLAEIRRLILAGQPKAAEQLVQDAVAGVPDIMRNYEPLCDLLLQFDHGVVVQNFVALKQPANILHARGFRQ